MTESTIPPQDVEVHCPECDYDLRGAADRCPWCGWIIDSSEIASSSSRRAGNRWAVAFTALLVGSFSLVAVFFLSARHQRLFLRDGMAVVAVLISALGHFTLAVLAVRSGRRWPMKNVDARRLFAFTAMLSIFLAVGGATSVLVVAPTPLVVQGIRVNGVFEFLLYAFFFAIPGVALLILRTVSFATTGSPFRRAGVDRQESPIHAPFAIDVLGRYRIDQVTTSWNDAPRRTSSEQEAVIAAVWEMQQNIARQTDRMIYNGELGRLISAVSTSNSLHLELGRTCFRDFLGTHSADSAGVEEKDAACLANPLGVSAVVLTKDDRAVLGRRNQRVLLHRGFLHTIGGMLEAADRRENRGYDIWSAILRELAEELGIRHEEVENIVVIGLVRDRQLYQPELLFEATLALRFDRLKERFQSVPGPNEHSALESVFDEPESVLDFLQKKGPIAPVAEAALLLHGRHHWGPAWYEQTCFVLYGEQPLMTRHPRDPI